MSGREGRRVAITGMAGLSPLGSDWESVRAGLRGGASGVRRVEALAEVEGLRTRLGAPVDFRAPPDWPRRRTRGMGRVAKLATRATELALADAGLAGSPLLGDGRTGLAYGSTSGSPPDMVAYARAFGVARSTRGAQPLQYTRLMSHTVAANLAQFFGLRGRVVPTCSACTSGSQGVGYGYEAIRYGQQEIMVCGGAEELHPIEVAVFDLLYATSTRNEAPQTTPQPFDAGRDGLVVGEGAATLVLESWEHARARGARVLAEVEGFGTNCDGHDLVRPDEDGMRGAMERALADAGLAPRDVGFVCAHATATEVGDVAESRATRAVLGGDVPVFSPKGHLGHTLGACGALESWLSVGMLREGWVAPTLHLEKVDPECAELDYVREGPRRLGAERAMNNNFAFGGVNTSLVFRRVDEDDAAA
ncbi:MAG: beta-ketoacyl-ACP synthase [Myxococcota bacterium]|nr:beta-ketoacyl-ACP synthase [Myxococcota bacterium]